MAKPTPEFRRRLALLLKAFGNSPSSLAEFLCGHAAFGKEFTKAVMAAPALEGDVVPGPSAITNLDQLAEYHESLLRPASASAPAEDSMEDSYLARLREALAEENYEAAAALRDMLAFIGAAVPEDFV